MTDQERTDRRAFLRLGGAAALALAAACSNDNGAATTTTRSGTTTTTTGGPGTTAPAATPGPDTPATSTTAAAGTALRASDFEGLTTCQVSPSMTEGPFYLRADLMRRDITEGKPGHPLRLGLRVVDVQSNCQPVPGAVVDVWHSAADGDYSAYAEGSGDGGPGTTFLRGSQIADEDGIVTFQTIYPGWYGGRAVHIHLKVHVPPDEVLTSQLYFPEDVNDRIEAMAPYASRGHRDTTNASDFVGRNDPSQLHLVRIKDEPTERGTGMLGLVVLGITR